MRAERLVWIGDLDRHIEKRRESLPDVNLLLVRLTNTATCPERLGASTVGAVITGIGAAAVSLIGWAGAASRSDSDGRRLSKERAIVPAPSSGGLSRAGVLCLGSATPNYFEGDGYLEFKLVARGIATEFHDWWVARMKDELIASAHITVEDIALLAHERRGHSTKVIARNLHASITSINSRFQRLNVKLKVPNRRAAARKAAEYGLI